MIEPKDSRHMKQTASAAEPEKSGPEVPSGRGRSRRRPLSEEQPEFCSITEEDKEAIYEASAAKRKKRKKKKEKKKSASFSLPSLPKIKLPSGLSTLCSRISQLVCFLLMAYAAAVPLVPLYQGRDGLGSIRLLITERNYSLACYLALSGSYLAFTALSALWILTKRHFASGDKIVSADMGRGMSAFLLLTLVFRSAPLTEPALAGQPLLPGAVRFLEIMIPFAEPLSGICALGFLLSLMRRILKR